MLGLKAALVLNTHFFLSSWGEMFKRFPQLGELKREPFRPLPLQRVETLFPTFGFQDPDL